MFIQKTQKEILKELQKRPLENIDSIKVIEDFLLQKRGYIFKMPKPGESVILLLSGGADSIVLWDILMAKYKLNVYPIFVTQKRGLLRWIENQYRSIRFFEKYYYKKYSGKINSPFVVFSGNFLRNNILMAIMKNPVAIMDNIYEDGTINIQNYSTTNLIASIAFDYSQLLQAQHDLKVKTIFTANLAGDGEVVQNQTLTSLRSIMFNLCNISNDYEQQFTSLFLEKELGFFLNKDIVVKWAKNNDLPIVKTWTCWKRDNILPCGICMTCQYRKHTFQKNGLKDRLYASDIKNWLLHIRARLLYSIMSVINHWRKK